MLSHNEFLEVANQLHSASKRKRKFGVMVSGFMLQMLDIAKGQEASIMDDDLDVNLESSFPLLIDRYKTSFKPIKAMQFKSIGDNSDVASVDRSITAPTNALGHVQAPSGRIKSNLEIIRKGIVPKPSTGKPISVNNLMFQKTNNKKIKQQSCSFCGSTEHRRITACPVLRGFGDPETNVEVVEYLKKNAPFSLLKDVDMDKIITEDISRRYSVKHMIMHTLHIRWRADLSSRPREDEFVVCISLLGDKSKPVPGYSRCLVDLSQVIKYIYTNQGKKNRFIFSHVRKESVGSQFVNTVIQNDQNIMIRSSLNSDYLQSNTTYPSCSLSTVKASHCAKRNESNSTNTSERLQLTSICANKYDTKQSKLIRHEKNEYTKSINKKQTLSTENCSNIASVEEQQLITAERKDPTEHITDADIFTP